MAIRTLQYLKTRFETGDLPTQADFTDLIDSCYNGLTALSGSGADPNLLLSYITNFNYFDNVLATLTASSLYGTSAEFPLFTSTNLSLTADQINVNLNEVEDLIKRSNTLLNVLTANTDTIEVNTDGVEDVIAGTNTKLDALTAVNYATKEKQDILISLLNTLTANTDTIEVNTDGVEDVIAGTNTKLDALTAVNYATTGRQDAIITLLNTLTANTDTIEVNTDGVEDIIAGTNTKLDVLTAVNYATAEKQDTIITLLDTLTANTDTIEVNTDGVEDVIAGTNTKLDVLTAVDFATGLKQDLTNTLLQILTANTSVGATSGFSAFVNQGALEYTLDSVSISGVGVDTIIAGINSANVTLDTISDDNINRTTTPGLTSKILISGSHRVYNVFGISTSISNQYIQFYDSLTPAGTPVSVFFVPANSNFSFDISRGLKFTNHLLIVNSLTPVVYTQGNDDLFMTLIHT